ncbi:MFS transporter [Paenibacillus sp. HJL G12]|uniref:MFS transporter n=1 Tax=Paenibacillus dendrobii TaxID=2691084 RepID=A0A7X3IHQ7_9BACL|nr:MFS transporter [Paenibacillus dendrobii]MWV43990.1 MFS transporter [Paenibacillus dendrobii]
MRKLGLLGRLSLCSIVLSTGLTLVWPINTIYMQQELGQSLTAVGLVLLLNNGAAFVGNVVGGILFDRWGGRVFIIVSALSSAGVVAAIGIVHDVLSYSVLLTMLGLLNGIIQPMLNAIAVAGSPGKEQQAVNGMFVSQNVGMAFGAALGGAIASLSMKGVFFFNALLYVVFLLLFMVLIRERRAYTVRDDGSNLPNVLPVRKGSLRWFFAITAICMGFSVSWLCYSQWAAIVPVHSLAKGVSFSHYSLLWTLNGALILASHPLKIWLVGRYRLRPVTQIIIGTIFLSAGLGMVGFAEDFSHFAAAMVVLTCGEVLVFPAVPVWLVDESGDGLKGKMLGICAAASTFGRMLGPLAGGVVYERMPGHWVFTLSSALCLLTVCNYWIAASFLEHRRGRILRHEHVEAHL